MNLTKELNKMTDELVDCKKKLQEATVLLVKVQNFTEHKGLVQEIDNFLYE